MNKKNLLIFSCSFLLAATGANAQSAAPATLNAAGGSVAIGGSTFDWSVGEMTMVSTFSTSSIIVTQGLLQPAPKNSDGVKQVSLLQDLQVFPNPASSIVNIQFKSSLQGTLDYVLMDMIGKTIMNDAVDIKQGGAAAQVNIAALANASYMLKVTLSAGSKSKETTSYKIQKLN
jgi:hypothetical protein